MNLEENYSIENNWSDDNKSEFDSNEELKKIYPQSVDENYINITPSTENKSNKILGKKTKKKGRKNKNELNPQSNHTYKDRDNNLRKIKVHFHSYIIEDLNQALKNENNKFSKFFQDFQNDVTITTNKKLLDIRISEILSKIYSYKGLKNHNENVYKSLCKNKDYDKLFSLAYKDYYLKFLDSEEAKKLIEEEKMRNNDIQQTLKNFIYNYERKEPKIQKKYKDDNYKKKQKNLTYELLFGNKNKIV